MKLTKWQVLLERYAIRARAYSDAVAILGKANRPPAECIELLKTVNARRKSCMAAAEEVDQYIKQKADAAHGQ